MNRKQFGVLVVLLVVCAAVAWHFYQHNNSSWQSADQSIGGKLFPNLTIGDAAQMTIDSATNKLTIWLNNDHWTVRERYDYPANFSQISDLVKKLPDLKIIQHEDSGPSELPRFNLSSPGTGANSGTLVELKDQNGKTLASLLLGKDHMNQPANGQGWPDGRYVIANSNNADVVVVSETFDNVTANPADWLDKTFFKISNPKSIAATFATATNSWKLTRASETNDWELADPRPGEKLDSSKVDDLTSSFDSLSFNDVGPVITPPADATTVTVDTFDGTNYLAKIWPSADDNDSLVISIDTQGKVAAESQYSHWTYDIPSYSVESLLKPRSSLLETKTKN
jgi:hypothetical protein